MSNTLSDGRIDFRTLTPLETLDAAQEVFERETARVVAAGYGTDDERELVAKSVPALAETVRVAHETAEGKLAGAPDFIVGMIVVEPLLERIGLALAILAKKFEAEGFVANPRPDETKYGNVPTEDEIRTAAANLGDEHATSDGQPAEEGIPEQDYDDEGAADEQSDEFDDEDGDYDAAEGEGEEFGEPVTEEDVAGLIAELERETTSGDSRG